MRMSGLCSRAPRLTTVEGARTSENGADRETCPMWCGACRARPLDGQFSYRSRTLAMAGRTAAFSKALTLNLHSLAAHRQCDLNDAEAAVREGSTI
jgi:hypothetical protein